MTGLVCNSFWDGPTLSRVTRECLQSFLDAGHPVRLWCYSIPAGIPEGVEVRDAAELVSPELMVRHVSGSPAPFANLFRYELMAGNLGAWVDCDILCLRPLPNDAYLFGYEGEGWINNAVLRLPSGSPILEKLRSYAHGRHKVMPWMSSKEKMKWWLKHTFMGKDIRIDKWGFTGPKALTYLVKTMGLEQYAKPESAFNPLPIVSVPETAKAGADLRRFITSDTYCVHLWNKHLVRLKPEPGSFIEMIEKGTWRDALI